MCYNRIYCYITFFVLFLTSCKSPVKSFEDKLYSRHLQRHVTLTVTSTTMPDDKSTMNLLICTNTSLLEKIHAQSLVDSLYRTKKLAPLELVGIGANEDDFDIYNRQKASNNSSKFAGFVID